MCSEIPKLTSESTQYNYKLSAEFSCTLYNLHYYSTKLLLKETLFKNYGFLLKDFFYLVLPSCSTFQNFERILNRIGLVGIKLNNKFYLKKESSNLFLELSYEKCNFLFVYFLYQCLNHFLILYRNDVS